MEFLKITSLSALALCTATGLAQAQQDLSMWARSSSEAFMPTVVAAFNDSQKDYKIDIQIVPSNEMVQKYAIAAAGGSAPDFVALDLIYTPAFAQAGQLEDMTDWATAFPTSTSCPRRMSTRPPMTARSTACRCPPTARC